MSSITNIPESLILDATKADSILNTETVQSLWGGNGRIVRVWLGGGTIPSVVVKCIHPDASSSHPRGWNSNTSFQRKLHSYQVESNWYQNYAGQCTPDCEVPKVFTLQVTGENRWFVLEDLDVRYPRRFERLSVDVSRACLRWLAHFHALFFTNTGEGLWPVGTYWHLATRQDEFAAMADGALKNAAQALDEKLNRCRYKTLVHGDAKVANFCFSEEADRVAMVDFQYVGPGCGIKDVVYFLGSCLNEENCAAHSEELLDYYFSVLSAQLPGDLGHQVEQEWRELYATAWADFHRFLAGWMPEHQKINRYTEQMTNIALQAL